VAYKSKLYTEDGEEAGEASYVFIPKPGETIKTGDGRTLRVLDYIPVCEDSDIYWAVLKMEAA